MLPKIVLARRLKRERGRKNIGIMLPKIVLAALLVSGCVFAQEAPKKNAMPKQDEASCPLPLDAEVVKRGAPLGDSPLVSLAAALREPEKFAGKRVVIEGVAARVCSREGCWMEVAPRLGATESVRVTFKDHGFSVPLNSQGMRVRAEGEFVVKRLSKEQADHYAEEGARLIRNADGTANEIGFIATGVELRR